jgi:hypothetical protein
LFHAAGWFQYSGSLSSDVAEISKLKNFPRTADLPVRLFADGVSDSMNCSRSSSILGPVSALAAGIHGIGYGQERTVDERLQALEDESESVRRIAAHDMIRESGLKLGPDFVPYQRARNRTKTSSNLK